MELRIDVWIWRLLVVGFVDEERVEEANSSEIHYIQILCERLDSYLNKK